MSPRRQSPAARKAARLGRSAERAAAKILIGPPAPVCHERLVLPNVPTQPDFVGRGTYVDQLFTCQDCGRPQVWTATQQKWWFEVMRADVWDRAIRCRGCRRRQRERKAEARRLHLEGLAAKRAAKA